MSKVFIIEKKDALSFHFANQIARLKKSGVEVERVFWSFLLDGGLLNTENDDIVLLETTLPEHLEHFDMESLQRSIVHLCGPVSSHDQEIAGKIKIICTENSLIAGVLDLAVAADFYSPFFRRIAQMSSVKMQIGRGALAEIELKLRSLFNRLDTQLSHARGVYNKLLAGRHEQIRGIDIITKYRSGQEPGGEFFDIVQTKDHLLFFLSSSNSYIASGTILSCFAELQNEKELSLDHLKGFLRTVHKQTSDIGKGTNESNKIGQIFIGLVDLKTFIVEGFNFGHALLFASDNQLVGRNDLPVDPAFFDQAAFQVRFGRAQKYLLLSPGFEVNCGGLLGGRSMLDHVRDAIQSGSPDLVNDLMFELKKLNNGEFLLYDASVALMEVSPNVIIQV